MKLLLLLLTISLAACGKSASFETVLTSSAKAASAAAVAPANYLPDPSNPYLNGRWRATQTICGSQAAVAVPAQQDMVFTNGTARTEMIIPNGCGNRAVNTHEVGYEGAALTVATLTGINYDASCNASQIAYSAPTYASFTISISGMTLSLIRANNCDGHGASYVTQYQYYSAQ